MRDDFGSDEEDDVFIAYISMPYYKGVRFRFSGLVKISKEG